MKGKMMKPPFAKGKKTMPQGFMDGGKVKPMMKMADGGYACGKTGSLAGKNMKKGGK